jgi:hypothetical protein
MAGSAILTIVVYKCPCQSSLKAYVNKGLGLLSDPAVACDFNLQGPKYPTIFPITLFMLWECSILGLIHFDAVVI